MSKHLDAQAHPVLVADTWLMLAGEGYDCTDLLGEYSAGGDGLESRLSPETAQANARRMAAAWNACREAGVPTEALESGVLAEMVAALEAVRAFGSHGETHEGLSVSEMVEGPLRKVRAARAG